MEENIEISIEELIELLKDEKCCSVEGLIVNGCKINFERIKTKNIF